MNYPIFEQFQKAQQINGWKTINGAKVFFEAGKVKYGAENLKEHVNGKLSGGKSSNSLNESNKKINNKEFKKQKNKMVASYIEAKMKENSNFRTFGVHSNDMLKVINNSDKTHTWDNDYFNKVVNAIDKTYESLGNSSNFSNLDNFDDSKLKQSGYKLVEETSKTHSQTGKRIPYDKIYSNGDKQIIIQENGNGKINAHLKFDDSDKTDRQKRDSFSLGSTVSLSYEPSIESKKELDKILNDFLTKEY